MEKIIGMDENEMIMLNSLVLGRMRQIKDVAITEDANHKQLWKEFCFLDRISKRLTLFIEDYDR